jgi:hypothetical protein
VEVQTSSAGCTASLQRTRTATTCGCCCYMPCAALRASTTCILTTASPTVPKEAVAARGWLVEDTEWHRCLDEAACILPDAQTTTPAVRHDLCFLRTCKCAELYMAFSESLCSEDFRCESDLCHKQMTDTHTLSPVFRCDCSLKWLGQHVYNTTVQS